MALNGTPPQTLDIDLLTNPPSRSGNESGDDEELEKLEADVAELADRILHYRRTLPGQLKEAFSLLTSAESLDILPAAEAGASTSGGAESSGFETPLPRDRNEEAAAEKINLLKQKTLANASAVPPLLRRMSECISRINNLNSSKDSIHPAFKIKRDRLR